MGLFWHTHKWVEFVCTIKDLGYPRLSQKIDNCYIRKNAIALYGQKPGYNEVWYPSEAKVIYKTCECGAVNISLNDGSGWLITFEKEYIRVIIEQFKKKKEQDETNRLLNYGNVDYQKLLDTQQQLESAENTIGEYKTRLEEVQQKLKQVNDELKKSQENDAIWAVIPQKVKKELFAKYEKKIK